MKRFTLKGASMADQKKKKIVLDTNILILDANSLDNFKDNDIYLHGVLLQELDSINHGDKHSEMTKRDAREALRRIDDYEKLGSFVAGVPTPGGGKLYIDYTDDREFSLLPDGFEKSNDNRMILLAKKLQIKNPDYQVVFVSNDRAPRFAANACGILAEPYKHGRVKKLYSGTRTINLYTAGDELINKLYEAKAVSAKDIFSAETKTRRGTLFSNQCCYLRANKRSALAVYDKLADMFVLVQTPNIKTHVKIVPEGAEQQFAYHHLVNKKTELVTLAGPAGSGKTLVAVLAAWEQLGHGYDQILIFRPTYELGKPIGFLKGYLDQKFEPWTFPILDAFERMLDFDKFPKGPGFGKPRQSIGDFLKDQISAGLLEILPINFIQGRNLHGKFVIVDETQNFPKQEMKMILTRAGEGTKMVLTGDPGQIANPFIDERSNGLTQVINEFKNCENYAHITMTKTKRSHLCEQAARLL